MAVPYQLVNEVERVLRETVSSLVGTPWQNNDGGFGREPRMPSEPWSTSRTLVLAERAGHVLPGAVALERITAMRQFILTHQCRDGGWGSDPPVSDAMGTALALMALRACREQEPVRAAAWQGVRWLAEALNNDGGWNVVAVNTRSSTKSMTYSTLYAYEAITLWWLDSIGPIALVLQARDSARTWLRRVRSGPGLGDFPEQPPTIRDTAYAVLVDRSELFAKTSCESPLNLPCKEITRWLENRQHTDGTWSQSGATNGSGDVETTAAAVRALLLLGHSPNSRRVRAAIKALVDRIVERKDGDHWYRGWPSAPGGLPNSLLTYYVAMALLDYLRAVQARRTGVRIWFPWWRRVVAPTLFIMFGVALAATILLTGTGKWASMGLTGVAAIANILVALPLIRTWLRRCKPG